MLGEIFGLNAGLTSCDPVLFRFFEPRPAPLESGRLGAVEPVGDAIALKAGDVSAELTAPADGVLSGPSFGVLRGFIRGVACSSVGVVSSLARVGRPAAGSGRAK